ncbi:hypothetical protein [Chromobacterium sp. IIBBL 290-4]|uniref:hypothetical protein n=1 Tax=Chromobacterium sp. IIBBL 290-4 TaxID=2953890 RepID=UPI0020B83D4B|nr:hypothetical protein [Chromobacterium sp. IIBBL 290-4]UTH74626.1 hypothetical protein NKT35_00470 [Chromobacterium sp. IIBBL 290-4]
MTKPVQRWVELAGVVAAIGAVLHLAIIAGGPAWYAYFGAPAELVAMAEMGHWYPAVTCVIIAACLSLIAAYAFSRAGWMARLTGERAVLGLAGALLVARGLSFAPLAHWRPETLSSVCGRCGEVNLFLIATSMICLFLGGACLAGSAILNDGDERSDVV